MRRLGLLIAAAASVLTGACGGGSSTGGSVSATIGGVPWHAPGHGFIITGTDGTSFDVLGATPLPGSSLLDSNKPQILIVFLQGVPSVGTYGIDGVTVNVTYQVDTNTVYTGDNGSVQIASISNLRAMGAFNFEANSPIANPMVVTLADGAFDVPVSAH
jgi:hypothetical protein